MSSLRVLSSCRVFVSHPFVVLCLCAVFLRRVFVSCLRLGVVSSSRVLVSCPRVVSYGRVFTSYLSWRSWRRMSAFGFMAPIRFFSLPHGWPIHKAGFRSGFCWEKAFLHPPAIELSNCPQQGFGVFRASSLTLGRTRRGTQGFRV